MKTNSEFTIVYVFGPEQCSKKYIDNDVLTRDAMEWVKIGQTDFKGNIDEVTPEILKEQSMTRIKREIKTGIPVTCMIYDVFIFPKIRENGIIKNVKIDNLIRRKLCEEIYSLDNSMQINKGVRNDKSLIPAGDEFVYGASRPQILYAVQSYDHELFSNEEYDINMLAKICECNNKDINSGAQDDDKERMLKRKPMLDLNLILEEGAEVTLTNGSGDVVVDESGNPITAKYVGNNKFDCKGEVKRSSPLALKYLNDLCGKNMTTINGNEYWRFEGQKLSDLRKNWPEDVDENLAE
jgi:hypothetical protein